MKDLPLHKPGLPEIPVVAVLEPADPFILGVEKSHTAAFYIGAIKFPESS